MGECIEKISHSCGTRRGLQVFVEEDGTYNGYCFSCNTFVPDPYKDKPKGYKPQTVRKSAEEIEKEIEFIGTLKTLALPDRKLKKESLEYFGIKIGVSESDGETPDTHFYPYYRGGELRGYKARHIATKRMWAMGDLKDVDLFGWNQAISTGSKTLIITEGELDAVAFYQIYRQQQKQEYADFLPAVVSLPHGAGPASKDLSRVAKEINKHFSEIVLAFDQDKAGEKATEDVLKIFPYARVVSLPSKDFNQCLIDGRSKAAFNAAIFNAKKPKNTRLVWTGSELFEAAKKHPEFGYSWPWRKLTDITRGIRLGETYYLGAGVKMGKSEVVNALAAHFISEHKWKVFMAKPEEANVKTVKLVAGKLVGKIFHDPKVEFDEEAYERATEIIKDNLCLVNLYQNISWETLQADIREAAAEGCKGIIIDPITNLTNGMESSAANIKLQEIAQTLASMAADLNVAIFIFCHLKAPESGFPHERGGSVLSTQFAGSRAMMRSCNYMIGIEGNKDPELDEEQRNIRKLVILEDREFGESGIIPLYWDRNTSLFNEI